MASIRKRGTAYQITVSNGRKADGSQMLETTTFIPDPDRTDRQNQKALDVFAVKFEEQVKNGTYLDGEKITFQEFSEKWMVDYAAVQLEATTVDIYKILLIKHIYPNIGYLKLSKIQPTILNKLYNAMLQSRLDKKNGGYSPTTIKRVHALISSILSAAVRWNILLNNPCERVKTPKQVRNAQDIKFFTLEETEIFLKAIDTDLLAGSIQLQHKLFFHLSLFCGLRRGETVALTWEDIDFNVGSVDINKSTGLVSGKAYTKAPKNKSSCRIVSMPASVINIAKEWRKEQIKYRFLIGSQWVGESHIFIQRNGAQLYPSTPYCVFKEVIHRYNNCIEDKSLLLPDIPLHGLRHTSATLLISQNIDVRTVSGRLGHAQTSTTMNIYSHSLKKMDEKASDTLENLFNPQKNETLVKC